MSCGFSCRRLWPFPLTRCSLLLSGVLILWCRLWGWLIRCWRAVCGRWSRLSFRSINWGPLMECKDLISRFIRFYWFFGDFSCQSVQNLGLAVVSMFAGIIVDRGGFLMLELFFIGWLCGEYSQIFSLFLYSQFFLPCSIAPGHHHNLVKRPQQRRLPEHVPKEARTLHKTQRHCTNPGLHGIGNQRRLWKHLEKISRSNKEQVFQEKWGRWCDQRLWTVAGMRRGRRRFVVSWKKSEQIFQLKTLEIRILVLILSFDFFFCYSWDWRLSTIPFYFLLSVI